MAYDVSILFQAVDKFSPALKEMQKSLANFEKENGKAEKAVKKLEKSSENALHSLKHTAIKMAEIFVTGEIAKYIIENTESLEKMRIRLEAVSGTAVNTAKTMKAIRDTSLQTGIMKEDVGEVARKFYGVGYGVDQVNKKIKQMSMLALVSGQDIGSISSAFIRAKTQGFIQPRMLAKLSQMGIPLIEEIKKLKGMNDAKWTAFLRKGGGVVGEKTLNKALDNLTEKNKNFITSYDKMLHTTGVSVSRIKVAMGMMAGAFGEAFFHATHLDEKLVDIAKGSVELSEKFSKFLDENPRFLEFALTIGKVVGVLYGLRVVSGLIMGIAPAFAAAVDTMTAAMGLLSSTAMAVMLALYGIAKVWYILKGIDLKELMTEFGALGQAINTGHYEKLNWGSMAKGYGDTSKVSVVSGLADTFYGKQASETNNSVNVHLNGKKVATHKINSGTFHTDIGDNFSSGYAFNGVGD